MKNKSVVSEAKQVHLAVELIHLGARLQMLEAETGLSRERLLRLYKEVKGASPPKGMLPYSTDWFTTWLPNIHSSLFMNIYRHLTDHGKVRGVEAIVSGYRLYLEHLQVHRLEQALSLTRAWTLVRFFEAGLLQTSPCTQCRGHFVVHTHELYDDFVCGLCRVPSRAGKTRKPGSGLKAA